jgi:hypothetical protein
MSYPFIVKDTMANMRNLSSSETSDLQNGIVKGVQLLGYYQKGDTPGPINYYLSNTPAADDGGSVISVGGIKLEHHFNNVINVAYYGAKGDNLSDNNIAFQQVVNKLTSLGVMHIPSGQYKLSKLVLPSGKYGLNIRGEHETSTVINFTDKNPISVRQEFTSYKNIRFSGVSPTQEDEPYYMFTDERGVDKDKWTPDIDANFHNCQFGNTYGVIKGKGRGIHFDKGCSFFGRIAEIINADFPSETEWSDANTSNSTYAQGFRGFSIKNSRVHYTVATLMVCNGNNAENIRGISIENNYIEGDSKLYYGYANNLDIVGNTFIQSTNTDVFNNRSTITILGGSNINIDVNMRSLDYSVNPNRMPVNLFISEGFVTNVNIRGVIDGCISHVIHLKKGCKNINIDLLASNVGRQGALTSFLKLEGELTNGVRTQYDNISVKGIVQSNSSSYNGLDIDTLDASLSNLDISGLTIYGTYGKVTTAEPRSILNIKKKTGLFVGNGQETGTKITCSHKPKIFKIWTTNANSQIQGNKYFDIKNIDSLALGSADISISHYEILLKGDYNLQSTVYYYEYE